MLDVNGLNTFYGRAHILHDVSLSVSRGEVIALLGRNGAGKSTTMKTVMGLVRPQSGTVRFRDTALQNRPAFAVCREGIGYVPEERRIFADLTVLENLEVGRRPPRDDAPQWSEEKLFALFPNLAERRHNLGGHMSGGEQQMLTIARTLMGNPLMILLDEPSEGIAPVIVEQMAKTIMALKSEGLTVLLSEQNLHFARAVADRAYIIEKGTIRYDGTMSELEAHPEVREKYLAL
ncbi:ABC transporter ATP-binding protein [Kaustia mangrovi]|uniref:ABC transporter ATP-binding protein n=1 Tax=Kaustia mangrovi TaxID=2593653 RepID=A0A7S8C1M0_9HYPH|nr:ABC transporter ATP-binding protein [Kaustia mangrovi]QPC41708.1 ABC transporter ATP-binding protein [Kaustia mangrovi]